MYKKSTDANLRGAGPVLEQSLGEFSDSNSAVSLAATDEGKAHEERDLAMALFEKEYDSTRSTIHTRMPYAEMPARASAMGTPDDVINSSKTMQTLMFRTGGVDENHPLDGQGEAAPTGEPWAVDLARQFIPRRDTAAAAVGQAVAASEALAMAIELRAGKRATLEANLLRFRRVVRDVYGPRSRQYRSLRDRSEPENEPDQAPPPAEPTPNIAV